MFLSVLYSHTLLVITWGYGIVSKPQMFTKTIMYSFAVFPNVNIAAQLTGDPYTQGTPQCNHNCQAWQIRANLAVSQSTFPFVMWS